MGRMASGRSSKQDPQKTREAVAAISAWIDGEAPQPARALLADACRRTARTLAEELPGKTVELRVPPFVAVQCVDGPAHTRGTPPNVVEMGPETWLRVATGRSTFEAEVAAGAIDASGSRAEEIARGLPVIARS